MPDPARVNGWIVLDKPLELGSTQAVSAVKRNLRQAGLGKVKVGHGGTLDPLATGVLPIAIGEATKLCGRMLDASKIYAFTIAFGTETSGLDAEGEVVATSEYRPSRADVEAIFARFTGPIEQVPPAYSAIKIDGKRAYDRARAGEEVPCGFLPLRRRCRVVQCGTDLSRVWSHGGLRPERFRAVAPSAARHGRMARALLPPCEPDYTGSRPVSCRARRLRRM